MTLLIALLFWLGSSAFAQSECTPPANPTHYILFMNVNASKHEADSIRKAACERGEGFVQIPDSKHVAYLGPLVSKTISLDEEEDYLNCNDDKDPKVDRERCEKIGKEWDRIDDLGDAYIEKHQIDLSKNLLQKLNWLDRNNGKISAVILSGHYSATEVVSDLDFDDIGLAEFRTILLQYSDVVSELRFFGLWGCDSINTVIADLLKLNFPSLRLMAGFYESGPANVRVESYQLIENLLLHEESIIQSRSQKELKKRLLDVEYLFETYSGVYAQLEDQKQYIHFIGEYDKKPKIIFEELDPNDCLFYDSVMASVFSPYEDYLNGVVGIPESTTSSPLRRIFDLFRQYPRCHELGFLNRYSVNQIGLLLFFDRVKLGFSKVFKSEIEEADKLFQKTSLGLFALTEARIKKLKRIEILNHSKDVEKFISGNALIQSETIVKYLSLVKKYLVSLDPNCMEYMDWHNIRPNHMPTPLCTVDSK